MTDEKEKEELASLRLSLSLRPMEESDVDDFMEWATDEKVSRQCQWDTYTSREQALDYIKNQAIPHPWCRVICIHNRAIGSIAVTPFPGAYDRCRAELGYVLAHKYWGKGIVTAATKMVVSSIFQDWPHLKRLQAKAHVHNKASQRVLEKAGFQREAILNKYILFKGNPADVVMFSVISED